MKHTLKLFILVIIFINSGCRSAENDRYRIPSEFEEQEYIWFSWYNNGFLTGEPFYYTILDAIKEIHGEVKVKLFYGPQTGLDKDQMQARIWQALLNRKIDTSRVELLYSEIPFGAIQDPGPIFLRNQKGAFAIADFAFLHPDKRSAEIDQHIAAAMKLPVISSSMVSEGGAWQTNGQGTMLAVESVELDRNKTMTKKQIEEEYKRVLGVTKIIWLKNGLKEEEWGHLGNGKYGIGTGGHIDEFCRFVNDSTVLLAAVDKNDTISNDISKESYQRMEENYRVLKQSTDQDGKPFEIIRLPAGPLLGKKVAYHSLSKTEQSWFDDVKTDSVEFYLATGYMNFVIANNIIVTAKFWKENLPLAIKETDDQAKLILEKAFPGRKVMQIDCMPLHHDGAGLHCHSRNQPKGNAAAHLSMK